MEESHKARNGGRLTMVFTEEDAENDGLIKREVGQKLNSVLSRKGGKLYRKFIEWCDENGRDPSRVIGDHALRAMRNDEYAEELSSVPVDVGALEAQRVRKEDLDMVTDMIEELNIGDDGNDSAMSAIDRMIEQRIEAMGNGPLGNMQKNGSEGQANRRHDEEIERLERKLERIEEAVSQSGAQQESVVNEEPSGGDSQGVDDIFDSIQDSGEDVVESEVDDGVDDESEVDEGFSFEGSDETGEIDSGEDSEDGEIFSTEEAT